MSGWKGGSACGCVRGYNDESDEVSDSNESLEELFAMVRAASRFPNTGDDPDDTDDEEMEDVSEEAGLGHALATRTPGPKIRRGDVDPLHLGMGMEAGMKEMGMWEGLGRIEGDSVGFADWSGSSCVDLGADAVETVETGRYF